MNGEYTNITYIYGLYDFNEPNIIKYIGKSNNPKKRLSFHKWERKTNQLTKKINWIKSVDGKISMKILKICPLSDYELHETFCIKLYKSDKLTNSDETGKGNKNKAKEIVLEKKLSKKVYQFDINGNFIKEFKSARETGRLLNIHHSHIIRCCNNIIKHTNGFIFKYNKDEKIISIINPNAMKKTVIEYDRKGNKINEWKSLMDCCRETKIDNGNLSKVCNNKLPSIKGRFFKFIIKIPLILTLLYVLAYQLY